MQLFVAAPGIARARPMYGKLILPYGFDPIPSVNLPKTKRNRNDNTILIFIVYFSFFDFTILNKMYTIFAHL